jgi:hypothetical protein
VQFPLAGTRANRPYKKKFAMKKSNAPAERKDIHPLSECFVTGIVLVIFKPIP